MTTSGPTVALAQVLAPLDARRALTLRETFEAVIGKVEEWQTEARGLTVTAEEQTGKMARARLLRLEIKRVRVDLDKRRKDLKAGILVEGRAIDGAFAVFEGLAAPLEKHLLEQEQFGERLAKQRADALRDARAQALQALGVSAVALPAALGEMSEEAWTLVLADAHAAKAQREEAARVAEAARVEAARIIAEREAAARAERIRLDAERQARDDAQRAENERLRAEFAAAERAHAEEQERRHAEALVERQAAAARQHEADEKARVEREARERAEAEAESLRKAEEDRLAREAESRKPTKAKYAILLAALKRVAASDGDPVSVATEALRTIGET
jgi:hypothetical protein